MIQYVLCYASPRKSWPGVLLIEKKRPDWQVGRFNLPGGHIEEEETIHEAASRELEEETGLWCPVENIRIMGTIEGHDFIVYICHCSYDRHHKGNKAVSMTDERIFWMPIKASLQHPNLIENLRLIIPFCHTELMGWHITEQHGIYTIYDEGNNEKTNIS